jgi:transposase InsO family protein
VAKAVGYYGGMDDKTKQDIALFRISVLGPLVSARLEHGDVLEFCREAAEHHWAWPDGTIERLSADTIRSWYYAFRRGGFAALKPKDRADLGTSDIRPDLADLLLRAKREKPSRSCKRLIEILVRAKRAHPGELSKSSVHRLLARNKVSRIPPRGPSAERRSYLHEFAGDLLIGDVLHPKQKVIDGDRARKAYLISELDCATRYIPESDFALSEDAPDQEAGLKRVVRIHGLWRALYVDRGGAYIAHSLKLICADLEMRLLHTGSGDPEAKGAIERWHRRWRAEVESELPDYPIQLGRLREIHHAWLSRSYHETVHDTTRRRPKEHWLELVDHLRPLPAHKNLDEIFLHRATRTVSKVGTVRWLGGRLEVVSPDLANQKVELRYLPNEPDRLPKVFVDDKFVCDTVPLDLFRNAHRTRRRDLGAPDPAVVPTGLTPLEDLVAEEQRLTAPMAFLAEKETADDEDAFEG